MANQNNIDGTISTTNTQIVANGYKLPEGFNNSRQPGELANLFDANSSIIYDKFSAKTGYTGLLKFGPRQPFITSNPNKHSTLFSTRAFPFGSAVDDVQRITKWSLTGDGVVFLGKQFFLQGQNSFNETKLYNPLMPIQSVASTLSFGLIPTPTRHIDFSSLTSFLGFGSSPQPVSTTVASSGAGKSALSDRVKTSGNPYKGLIRGSTASDANTTMTQKWTSPSIGGLLGNYFKSGFNKIFGGLIPVGQPANTYYRADEGMYGIMLGAKDKFVSSTSTGDNLKWGTQLYQRWQGGDGSTQGIRKSSQTSITDSKKLLHAFNGTIPQTAQYFGHSVGYSPKDNNYKYRTYGDNVGIVPIKLNKAGTTSYEYSDILSVYVKYVNPELKSEIKFSETNDDAVKNIKENLDKLITNIESAGYLTDSSKSIGLIMQQFNSKTDIGYNNITNKTKDPFNTKSPEFYNGGYLTNFKNSINKNQLLDNSDGKGFATTNQADKINLLDISTLNEESLGQENSSYKKYESDQIAFFFYDIVNDKYIPFRATVKGLSESNTAEWNDVSYVGRADKLYTYKGFTRTLQFNFTVYINSVQELLPTWKRINYFCGLVKPANYTANGATSNFSRFIIPPMINFTIGDMYKNQPGVITSIGLSIPEDATWETLGEDGMNNYTNPDKDWNYLNGIIIWKNSKGKYAQFPRVADLSVSLNILEKEKPIVGGSQYGDVYRDSNFKNMQSAGDFSKQLIVVNSK